MPLINNRLLQRTLQKNQHTISQEKIDKLHKHLKEKVLDRIENQTFKKEEAEKPVILPRFFELLGYSHPQTFEFEFSNKTRSADVILGQEVGGKRIPEIAIEWKGINTKNLDGGKAGETPVSQMWDYMGKMNVEIGIVGNFLEWRVYSKKKGQTEFQEFKLRELVTDRQKLIEMIFLLSPQTLLKLNKPKSQLEELIDKSELEQEQITKQFYNDYKQRRTNLFEHLIENNVEQIANTSQETHPPAPSQEGGYKHLLLEKTQKILDRLILKPLSQDYFEKLCELSCLEDKSRTREKCIENLSKMLELCEKKINYSFVIFFDNQIVGRISLLREESLDYPEVGIHIFSEFRGRNIGFDATSLFFNWLVNNTQISRIYWESLIDNKPSQKLIEKFNPIKQTEIKEIEFEGKIEKYYVYEKNLLETSIPHKHLLLEKTQKILDRLIFIMFCEDEYLLPSNILKQTFELGKKSRSRSKTKIWEEFKYLFEDIDKGRYDIQPHINAFNGGLFADDTELNNLMIKDEIWQDLIKLAEYDFESDLNVNILGHIFEQSIADIEEIKADLEANPQNSTNFDPLEPNPQLSTKVDPLEGVSKTKKTSKRKKDGIYYTPEYITDYIVSETVDSWITENKQELEKITILDPAGGSGAFPNQVHNFLTKKWVEKMNQIALDSNLEALADFDEISIDKSILKNNIFMVDLQPESVEIAKLSLWLKTARKDQKLNNLDKNVKCGNSLISDPEIAGGTAFDWDKEFPEVMASGGFDVVVGNPPYVNAKNGNFTEKEKEYLYKNYETAEYQLDAYILFIEKAIRLLKDGGYTGFIIPNAWLGNVFVPKIREFLLKNTEIKQIVELGNTVFEDANVDTVILIVKKCTPNPEHEIKVGHFVEQKYEFRHTVKQSLFLKNKGFVFDINLNDKNREIIEKIEENSVLIDDILEVSTGIKEYQVGKGKPAQTQQDKNELRFNANFKKDDSFVPELRGKNIDRYESHWQNEFVSYGEWIAEPRKPKFFEGERVLLRKIPAPENLVATFTDEKFVIDQSLYIALNEEKKFNTKYILACLNSKILGWYFKYKNNEFDGLFPQIKINQFKSLPIPTATPAEQAQIAQLVDEIMELKKDLKNYIQNTFTLWNNEFGQTIKINKKLENFHILTFEEFLNELKKQKINPTRDQKREAIQGFESDKQKVISKMAEIERVDGEIEGVVRGLYGV